MEIWQLSQPDLHRLLKRRHEHWVAGLQLAELVHQRVVLVIFPAIGLRRVLSRRRAVAAVILIERHPRVLEDRGVEANEDVDVALRGQGWEIGGRLEGGVEACLAQLRHEDRTDVLEEPWTE